jgi:hypothetical protein
MKSTSNPIRSQHMGRSVRPSTRTWFCGVAVAALASCVDPFGFDNKSQSDTSSSGAGGGSSTTGSTDSTNGSTTNSTTASTSSTTMSNGASGGSSGIGGAAGSSGGAGGGSGGSSGGAPDGGIPDSGLDASRDSTVRADAGDGGLGVIACATTRFYPPPPDGADVTCPPHVTDLNQFVPTTAAVNGCTPLPHPGSDCPFYFFSWQNFMIATQPDSTGKPAFLSWGTIENTFGSGAGQPAPATPELRGGVTQAGGRQVLIDQSGHAIYYAMHMNQPFVDFVNGNGLQTATAVSNADPMLTFPAGLVELKEAWMIVPDATPPTDYIVAKVRVPTLRAVKDVFNNTQVTEDPTVMRDVTVALLAIHVVFTLPGHPEFIWSTFQHVDATGVFDVAPTAANNPDMTPATTAISTQNFALFKGGTTAGASNTGIANLAFNETTQSFGTQQTSIYRMFPASKSNTTDFDGDIDSINTNMSALFASAHLPATDRRGHYRLVGAIWQDRPEKTMLEPNKVLTNDETDPDIVINGADSLHSLVGGEDRLSSVAMESFTQPADSFPNCFMCHDTRATTARGVPSARDQAAAVILQPKRINVSHIFNEVVRLNP